MKMTANKAKEEKAANPVVEEAARIFTKEDRIAVRYEIEDGNIEPEGTEEDPYQYEWYLGSVIRGNEKVPTVKYKLDIGEVDVVDVGPDIVHVDPNLFRKAKITKKKLEYPLTNEQIEIIKIAPKRRVKKLTDTPVDWRSEAFVTQAKFNPKNVSEQIFNDSKYLGQMVKVNKEANGYVAGFCKWKADPSVWFYIPDRKNFVRMKLASSDLDSLEEKLEGFVSRNNLKSKVTFKEFMLARRKIPKVTK